eukprot:s663_g17.t1
MITRLSRRLCSRLHQRIPGPQQTLSLSGVVSCADLWSAVGFMARKKIRVTRENNFKKVIQDEEAQKKKQELRLARRAHIREDMKKGMREKLEKVRAELEGEDPEAPAKTEDVEMDGSRACGQMTTSYNHGLFLVLCLLCWAPAPVVGDCLPEAVANSWVNCGTLSTMLLRNRTYIQDIDGNDIPIGFLRMDWRSSVIATAIARILVEEAEEQVDTVERKVRLYFWYESIMTNHE